MRNEQTLGEPKELGDCSEECMSQGQYLTEQDWENALRVWQRYRAVGILIDSRPRSLRSFTVLRSKMTG